MNKKKIYPYALLVLLCSVILVQNSGFVEANFMPMPVPQPAITIKEDGTISPASAAITRNGNVYTLTDDITGYTIAIDCDNVILDGANYSLNGENNLAGIFVQDQNNVKIQNFNIHGFTYGMLFTWLYNFGSSQQKTNTVNNNTLTGNTYGIYLNDYSKDNTLTANTLTNNTYGIHLSASSNNLLRNNRMSNNTYNFFVYGSSIAGAINDVDTSNTVDGKPIIYWINEENKSVPSDAGYIALVNCKEMIVQGFNLSRNGQAILLVGVDNSTVTNNTLTGNDNAMWVSNSENVAITKNVFSKSSKYTLYITSSNKTTVTGNTFINGGFNGTASEQALANAGQAAISILGSRDNVIYNNIFLWNGEAVSMHGCINHLITANLLNVTTGTSIHLFQCSQNNITGNTITYGKGIGIKVWSSDNNLIELNLIANNTLGILLDAAANNRILENIIANNTDWGMQLKSAGDTFSCSTNNTILHNNFINNQQGDGLDVSIPGVWVMHGGYIPGLSNIWDNGYEGNYWEDYKIRHPDVSEVPGAGIWDQAWVINENNIDHCPLMTPYPISLPQPTSSPTTSPNITPSPSPSPEQPTVAPKDTANPPPTVNDNSIDLFPVAIGIAVTVLVTTSIAVVCIKRRK